MDSNNLNDKQKSDEDLKTNMGGGKKEVNDEIKNISNNEKEKEKNNINSQNKININNNDI
jgi:hypothetical protein